MKTKFGLLALFLTCSAAHAACPNTTENLTKLRGELAEMAGVYVANGMGSPSATCSNPKVAIVAGNVNGIDGIFEAAYSVDTKLKRHADTTEVFSFKVLDDCSLQKTELRGFSLVDSSHL